MRKFIWCSSVYVSAYDTSDKIDISIKPAMSQYSGEHLIRSQSEKPG